MDVFFLSGLGADKTVFQFLDLGYCNPIFIDWIEPHKKESLQHYALRLKEKFIPDNSIVIGLSFGGMLATEIAKQYPSIKVILLSSAKTKNEIPAYYKTGKYLSVNKWAPGVVHKWFMLKMKWLFGLKGAENIRVYEELIKNSNPTFNNWAISAIINWDNTEVPGGIVHIHGTHDKVLPYKYIKCNHTIKQAGHLMVMEQSGIISEMLKEIIMRDDSASFSSASQPEHQHPG